MKGLDKVQKITDTKSTFTMKSYLPIKRWLLCCICDIEGLFVLALTRQEWFEFYLPISLSICVSL